MLPYPRLQMLHGQPTGACSCGPGINRPFSASTNAAAPRRLSAKSEFDRAVILRLAFRRAAVRRYSPFCRWSAGRRLPRPAQADAPANFLAHSRRPAAILLPATPAPSATPPRPPPIIAPRCAAIRATTNCSTAPSWRCWPTARSTRRSSSPSGSADRQDRPHRAAGARRACDQAEAISGGAPASRAVGPRADHRSRRDAAVGLDAMATAERSQAAIDAIDKLAGPGWYGIFKDLHAGLILELAGQRKKPASASSAPTSSIPRAARGAGLWQLARRATAQQGRGAQGLRGLRRSCCRAIR